MTPGKYRSFFAALACGSLIGGASAALALIGVESAFAPEWRTAAYGVAALIFAGLFMRQGWRATRYAALVAGALALAQALSANLTGHTIAGDLPLWRALLILAIAATALITANTTP